MLLIELQHLRLDVFTIVAADVVCQGFLYTVLNFLYDWCLIPLEALGGILLPCTMLTGRGCPVERVHLLSHPALHLLARLQDGVLRRLLGCVPAVAAVVLTEIKVEVMPLSTSMLRMVVLLELLKLIEVKHSLLWLFILVFNELCHV